MKKIAALLVVVLALLLTACGGNPVESEPASVDLMEQVQLTENEMKDSLMELARRMENQMRVSDPNAKARFRLDGDGRCSILVTESGDGRLFMKILKLAPLIQYGISLRYILNMVFWMCRGM